MQGPAVEEPAVGGPASAVDLSTNSLAFIGLVGFLTGAAIWWLLVARRGPSVTSLGRGVVIGAFASMAAIIVLAIVNALILLVPALRTEPAGSRADVVGMAAPLLVAGIVIDLLLGWPTILAGAILGGALASWFRRGAPSMPPGEFEPSRQAPEGRTRCDECGVEYPSHRYLTPTGSHAYHCRTCATRS
jgi:hypothetical protein